MQSITLLIVLLSAIAFVSCRIIDDKSDNIVQKVGDCAVVPNTPVHDVMERICEMCHEFYSHSRPNLRAECRSDCFSNEAFGECLKVFTPRRHSRHQRRF